LILIDANILMYAAGAEHPNKAPSAAYLLRIASGEIEATLDTESLQEILHRYRSIGRWAQGRHVYDAARRLFPVVLPITAESLDLARKLMDKHERLDARDALHAATALHHEAEAICSYDRDFDLLDELTRIEPPRADITPRRRPPDS